MHRDLIKSKIVIFGFLAVMICLFSSCAPHVPTDLENLMTNQFVHEDTFLSITNGSSFAVVKATLGPAVRHQFTVSDSGHTWILIRCFLHTGKEEGYNFYQLLFCDDALIKTIGSNFDWRETEEYTDHGSTESRDKPWGIEDMKGVRWVLDESGVTPEQIRAELKDARETMEKYSGHGNIPTAVFLFFAPAFIKNAQKAYPINEELRQRYDGCRASLGMSVKEVQTLYGEPLSTFDAKSGLTARLYGDHRFVDVDPFLQFSNVAVLFDKDGHAARIYSDGFFCADWDPVLRERKKAEKGE